MPSNDSGLLLSHSSGSASAAFTLAQAMMLAEVLFRMHAQGSIGKAAWQKLGGHWQSTAQLEPEEDD